MSDIDLSNLPPGIDPQDIPAPNYETCTEVSAICPVAATVYGDYFNLGGSIFFVVAHSIFLASQVFLCWRSRAWSFCAYLAIGTIFEIMGHGARISMSQNPWTYDGFVIQLVMLILGPTLVAASISVTFKHIVLWYGSEWSFIRPVLYPWVFVGSDFFSIVIQAVGGAISATATGGEEPDDDLLDVGSGLLIAGVVFQMVNMIFCGSLMMYYLWNRKQGLKKRRQNGGELSAATGEKPVGASDKRTKIFLWAISVAYIAIIVRCIYRIPEQEMGWGNDLMQNETLFLIFDSTMILIAVGTLTIFHPNYFFPFLSKKADKKVSGGVPPAEVEARIGVEEPEMGTTPESRHSH